jgi:hypothetical protein
MFIFDSLYFAANSKSFDVYEKHNHFASRPSAEPNRSYENFNLSNIPDGNEDTFSDDANTEGARNLETQQQGVKRKHLPIDTDAEGIEARPTLPRRAVARRSSRTVNRNARK